MIASEVREVKHREITVITAKLTVATYAVIATDQDGATFVAAMEYSRELAVLRVEAYRMWDPETTYRIILIDTVTGEDETGDANEDPKPNFLA